MNLNLTMIDTQDLHQVLKGRIYKVLQVPFSDSGAYIGGRQGERAIMAL